MRVLSVKNLAKYQHYKHRNPPWIKLYREVWTDYTLRKLTVSERLCFLGLSSLAMELENQIPDDPKYLSDRLGFAITSGMIVHLISSNLILSNLEEQIASAVIAERKQDASKKQGATTEQEWVAQLKANPAYHHINIDVEMGRMEAWLSTKPGRKKTKAFVVNWLNKIDPPLSGNGSGAHPPPPPPKNDPIGRGQWKAVYGKPEDYGYV